MSSGLGTNGMLLLINLKDAILQTHWLKRKFVCIDMCVYMKKTKVIQYICITFFFLRKKTIRKNIIYSLFFHGLYLLIALQSHYL